MLTRRSLLLKASLGLATMMASGCRSAQKLEVTQSGAPSFDRFRAEYRFEQAEQLLNRSFANNDAGMNGQVSARQSKVQTVSAETAWSHARLEIECPHPAGDPTLALLTLRLSDRQGPASFIHKDVRELTVERSDIDLLISDLANRGYFDQSSNEFGDAQLEVEIDRGKVNRDWFSDARLLDFARRTLAEGTPQRR